MSVPSYIQKTLVMKPEVSKIFDDLEAWQDYCRFNLIKFDPKDLYKSREYREWASSNSREHYRKPKRDFKPRREFH